jgi:CBS domain containing-hemolysin-like protein
MNGGDWIRWVLALLCVGVVAFTTMILIGYASSSRTRIAELATQGNRRARDVDDLLERYHNLQATMILLDTAAVGFAVALVTAEVVGHLPAWGVALVVFITVVVILVFGRAVPRGIALIIPEQAALRFAWLARFCVILLSPLTRLIDAIVRVVIALLRVPVPSPSATLATEEELIQLVRDEAGDNRIEEEEVDLVNNVFRFTDAAVRDVMVPRVDIVAVPRQATVRDASNVALEAGHSRLPVYERDIDRIVGIVYAKDLLRFVGRSNANASVVAVMRPPYFVPESMGAPDLLREMRARHVHIALVVDEYGGTAGVATIEDILEEIVGEIQDEYDAEAPLVESLPDGAFVVDARLEIEDFDELMGVQWSREDEEREPLAGYIYDYLGHIPTIGEEFTIDNIRVTILEMDNQRLEKVRVERLPQPPAPDGATDVEPMPDEAVTQPQVPLR